jgi:hypothetical protein
VGDVKYGAGTASAIVVQYPAIIKLLCCNTHLMHILSRSVLFYDEYMPNNYRYRHRY